MIMGRRIQFGCVECVSSLTSGCVDRIEVWWRGVMGMLCSVGFLVIVPAVSNRGVCLGTPTALTAADRFWNCAILMGTGRYAV